MKVLGISAFYHDSAAALVINGEVVAAAQEERFIREKNTSKFPINAIKYALEEGGCNINDLDAVVFYDKPLLKFERILETVLSYTPGSFLFFIKFIRIWLKEKLFYRNKILSGLKQVGEFDKKKLKLLFSEHHLSHAASAFYTSGYAESAALTIDGVGEWATASIGFGKNEKLELKKVMNYPHSVGLLYSSFTYYLGFKVNSGEYKLMGLASYGVADSPEVNRFIKIIKEKLIEVKVDGSIWMNQAYFKYNGGLKMVDDELWRNLFGFSRRKEEGEITQAHCDLAMAIQLIVEEIIIDMAKEAKRLTGSDSLCLAGGVALNCVANGKLLKEKIFNRIHIQPAAGDAGGALGCALAVYYMYFNNKRTIELNKEAGIGAYLGPYFSDKEVLLMNKRTNAVAKAYPDFDELNRFVAEAISKGKVVGWFQGRMEFGPRSLGNRSILADARNADMQKKLNLKIKYREGFRPFAPSVLLEDLNDYFDLETESPYMLFIGQVTLKRRLKLPFNFDEMNVWEKLYTVRSEIPAITHVDFSSRVQTVAKENNPRFWELLMEFKKQTGCSVMINTSFNVRGEPIVCSPLDAYNCFMNTEMDFLVCGRYVYSKAEQPSNRM
jgi:carbamoyltransferase